MITKFKLFEQSSNLNNQIFETGEWNHNIDWEYVKNNPDDDSEEAGWIKGLEELLLVITDNLNNSEIFEIIDIKGFDMYQGPYAIVNIFNKRYQIWGTEENILWIKNFPIDNTSSKESNPGFEGYPEEISDLLNEITDSGGDIEIYKKVKKYNI